jgi:hypothetical protein
MIKVLMIGVYRDEVDAPEKVARHPRNGVPAAAADADHLDVRGEGLKPAAARRCFFTSGMPHPRYGFFLFHGNSLAESSKKISLCKTMNVMGKNIGKRL